MPLTTKTTSRKPVRPKSRLVKKNLAASRTAKATSLAQINHWMEANADAVLKAARQNTRRLTGKETL